MKSNNFLKKKLPVNDNVVYIIATLIVLVLLDISRMPSDQVSAKVILVSIRQYQKYISPKIGGFVQCKFEPTCSRYGYTSVEWYGAFWGSLKIIDRLGRCTPWTDQSGWDPP
jgi:uncharacterized protein